jgi:uncharacterized membrane protein
MMCFSQAVDILSTGIVAGAFAIGTFALHPAAARLDPPQHIVFRQELICRLSRFLPPFMLLPLAAAPAAATLCRAWARWPIDLVGFALSVATVGITVAINAPLNRRFARWSPDAPPPEWSEDIRRWNRAHTLRMTTAIGAFACAIFAGR